VFGWSEGGTMVLNLLAANPGFFRAGVAVAPIANPFLHYGIYQERYRGLLSEHASAYRAGGPQFSSGLPEDNLLVLHGAADDHVHLQHSADYVRRFAGQPGVHELKIYAGRSHTMDEGPEGMAPVATDIVAFLDRYVGGGRGASAVDGDLKAYLCGLTGTGDHRAVAAGQFL
jgi:dipeptidyl-peptidase-4